MRLTLGEEHVGGSDDLSVVCTGIDKMLPAIF
jgi:hypothetical protein